jgi:hypothetical protein
MNDTKPWQSANPYPASSKGRFALTPALASKRRPHLNSFYSPRSFPMFTEIYADEDDIKKIIDKIGKL